MSTISGRQPSDSFPGPLSEARAASSAGGGTALTTSPAIVGFLNGTSHVAIVTRNYATGVVCQFALNPTLSIFKTADGFQSVTPYTVAGQKNPAVASSINLSSLDTLANGNALLIGAYVPFRGIAVVMSGSVNAVVSSLTVQYWNGAWTAVSGLTDGTASGGATFAQAGNITWTVPSDWTAVYANTLKGLPFSQVKGAQAFNINAVGGVTDPTATQSMSVPLYWTRLTVSAALTASTAANTMFALNRSTAYAELVAGALVQARIPVKGAEILGPSCVEAQMNAGTGNLIVNCYTDDPKAIF